MVPAKVCIVSGKWAAGKTATAAVLGMSMQDGLVKFLSDRIYLEMACKQDGGYDEVGQASRVPVFSEVSDWGGWGEKVFEMKDGFAVKKVRQHMVEAIKKHLESGEGYLIVELAIGPDVECKGIEGEYAVLRQTTADFIDQLVEAGVGEGGRFIQLEAGLETRMTRQGSRGDPAAVKAFELFASDGGEMDMECARKLERIGWEVDVLDNEGIPFEILARGLTGKEVGAEKAFEFYKSRLLSPEVLIVPPEEIFFGHPARTEEGGIRGKEQ